MEIKSSLINSKELKLLKDSLIAASEVDGKENFRVKLIEYVNDTADNEEDEFFYDMIEFCRFLKPDPETTAYTTPDHLIYLNAPGIFGEKVREWDFIYCHECLHQLWDTFGVEDQIKKNGIKFDHYVLNVASDCVINDYLSAIRKKSAPSEVILPEHLQKQFGVTYDRKVDTQFTLYLKLLEVAEKLRKDQKCQNAQDGDDGQEGQGGQGRQGGSSSGSSSSGSSSSGSSSSSNKNDNTAEGAQKSAGEAKKSADKAQQNADSGKGSQKDADAAKDAAKEAQDAADRAKDAANKGDKEGEAKAAQEARAAADRAKKLAGEGGEGKDGDNTAEGAQKSADEAKKAANKAQQNADSGKGSQKDADAAKEAAKEAQDAANRAKEAAAKGDKEGEAKAAKEAKDAADKAKKLAGDDGGGLKDKASGGKGQGHDSPDGVEITGELTEEQKAQIKAKAEGVI